MSRSRRTGREARAPCWPSLRSLIASSTQELSWWKTSRSAAVALRSVKKTRFRLRAHLPRVPQHFGDDGLELADVTEGDGTEEPAERGRRHHYVAAHGGPLRRAARRRGRCVTRAGADRVHEREDLATREHATSAVTSTGPAIATAPGSSKIISIRSRPRNTDEKGLPVLGTRRPQQSSLSQLKNAFWWICSGNQPWSIGGSRLRAPL